MTTFCVLSFILMTKRLLLTKNFKQSNVITTISGRLLIDILIVLEINMITNLTFTGIAIKVFSSTAFRTNFSRTALDAVCHASRTYWNITKTVFMMYFKALAVLLSLFKFVILEIFDFTEL